MRVRVVERTPFGAVGVVWSGSFDSPLVVRVLIPKPGLPVAVQVRKLSPRAEAGSNAEIDDLARRIKAFLEGENIRFSLDTADLSSCPPFQRAVLRAEHGVPRGRVTTYGALAAHLGRPGASRAVGNALANNPFPIIVPCHRAVRSDGALGGFQGGLAMKRALLENEGVELDAANRVVRPRFHYRDR
ncbi:MAG: methylated-DNA--[protein]-cysteine S-methyltransferase [Candidatus Aminicenantes bacterium]